MLFRSPIPTVQWPSSQPWPLHHPLRLGLMASGAGSNVEAVTMACREGTLQAEVALLVVGDWQLDKAIDKAFSRAIRKLDREVKSLERKQLEDDYAAMMSGGHE